MVGILEVDQTPTIRFSHQIGQYLLPDAPALVLQQSSVTGLVRGFDIVGHIFPVASGVHHIQNPIDHLPLVSSGPATLLGLW